MSQQAKGYVLVALAGTLWGFNGLFVSRLAQWGLSALGVAFVRYACATALMLVLLVWWGRRVGQNLFVLDMRDLVLCVAIGALTNALAFSANCVATTELGMTSAAVLLYTAPVFGCLWARLLYREHMTPQKSLACILNFLGVVGVVSGGDLSVLREGSLSTMGILAGLSNALLYSLAAPLNKPLAERGCPNVSIVFWSLASAAASAGLLCAVTHTSLAPLTKPGPLACSFLFALMASVVAYLLYTGGMARGLEVSRVPVLTSLEAVVAALVGAMVLHETLGTGQLLGMALVIGSIAVMNVHAPHGQAYGVHVLPSARQLQKAYRASDDLAQAVSDLRRRREQMLDN